LSYRDGRPFGGRDEVMKVSAFTFCRNIIELNYPLVESIISILPIVDEYVVNVGNSDDGTLNLVKSIKSDKIKIIESIWDDTMRKDGRVLSEQANIGLAHCTGDWAFYLQADEVVHENDLPKLAKLMSDHFHCSEVLGFMFRYLHFWCDYHTMNPWAYRREVRVVRNNGEMRVVGDGCGFRKKPYGMVLDKKRLGREVIWTGAKIYHYGWVNRPEAILRKVRMRERLWRGDDPMEEREERARSKADLYGHDYATMKEFTGSHPKVMEERVRSTPRFMKRRNRWLNWRFYKTVLHRGFKG